MFSISKTGKKDIHNSVSVSNGNEYSMFISINANDEKLDEKIFYYYPNNTVTIEKFTIHPEKPSFYLDFYKNNLNKYQEICQSVKLLLAMNSSLTKYTTSSGNIVKIKCQSKEKNCILTSFSLIKRLELDSDEDMCKVEIFMVSNSQNLYRFLKMIDFLISLNSPKEKVDYFESIKREFVLLKLESDLNILKKRSEFVKFLENTCYDYVFRDPKSDKLAPPALDILFLHPDSKIGNHYPDSLLHNNYFVEINLDRDDDNKSEKKSIINDEFLTFITYNIPRQKVGDILGRKKNLRIYKNNDDNLNYNKSSSICATEQRHLINYEEYRCLEFSKSCSVLYDRSINFGKYEISHLPGLSVGYYSFNENSAGTLLFNSMFKPIGVAFFGSYDFYPFSGFKKIYNLFLPFDHIGVQYILRSFLDYKTENFTLSDFLEKKNFNLANISDSINMKKKEYVQEEL